MAVRRHIRFLLGILAVTGIAATSPAMAETAHPMMMEAGHMPAADTRQVVDFPPMFKQQELTNMRHHLESLQLITRYLAEGNFQAASDTAEQRLTRGAMSEHDRHQAAHYMPKAMLSMGAAMHRAAGHFAMVAQDAGVSGDMKAALSALAEVQERCVACHLSYRMK